MCEHIIDTHAAGPLVTTTSMLTALAAAMAACAVGFGAAWRGGMPAASMTLTALASSAVAAAVPAPSDVFAGVHIGVATVPAKANSYAVPCRCTSHGWMFDGRLFCNDWDVCRLPCKPNAVTSTVWIYCFAAERARSCHAGLGAGAGPAHAPAVVGVQCQCGWACNCSSHGSSAWLANTGAACNAGGWVGVCHWHRCGMRLLQVYFLNGWSLAFLTRSTMRLGAGYRGAFGVQARPYRTLHAPQGIRAAVEDTTTGKVLHNIIAARRWLGLCEISHVCG